MQDEVSIIGAGPAGLTAAIHLARAGARVTVYEQHGDVGHRFHGDFQGIENWSMEEDARAFLQRLGIAVTFSFTPFREGRFYGPYGKIVKIRPGRPLFYLVQRGAQSGSLDQGLKLQALEAGVRFRWNYRVDRLPPGRVIVGTGPKTTHAVARGILFRTSHPDGYYGFFDDRIAPAGYAYLLIHQGRATFATCLFDDFRNTRRYFERAFQLMRQRIDIDINQPVPFGGYGNFFLFDPQRKDGRMLYVGETAGFQDALWGFGIRYAMLSGYLAAQSMIEGRSYTELCRTFLWPAQRTSMANRWLYAHLGNRGYQWILHRLEKTNDVVPLLQKHHRYSPVKRVFFQMARYRYRANLADESCRHDSCQCVWCRCGRGGVC